MVHNDRVGRHSAHRAAGPAHDAPPAPRRTLLLLALGLTATLVAWGVLVYAAIDFGGEARSGEPVAWVHLAITTIAAAGCLFATLLLGGRVLALLQRDTGPADPADPARPPGGRRAAR